MYEEPKMEKLTINLPPVEIARIDVLVEAGLYPSRTEFIRTAIRKTLDTHQKLIDKYFEEAIYIEDEADETDYKRLIGLGVLGIGKRELEEAINEGKKYRIRVAGLLFITSNVTPDLIERGVESVKVYGIVRASAKNREALKALKKK
jgi:Arc/MetJ-type ribon-helix-helix transcriptional regulator